MVTLLDFHVQVVAHSEGVRAKVGFVLVEFIPVEKHSDADGLCYNKNKKILFRNSELIDEKNFHLKIFYLFKLLGNRPQ